MVLDIRQNGVADKAKMAWGIRQNGVADKAKSCGGSGKTAWAIRQKGEGDRERRSGGDGLSRARVLYKDVAFTFSVSTNRAEYSTSQLSGLPMHKCPATPEDINSPTHPLKKPSTQRLIHLKAHQLRNSPTQPLQNLKPYLLFYNVTLIFAPF